MQTSVARVTLAALAPFALFAFLLNFAWEMLQTPFFSSMPVQPHWSTTLFCLRATLGDVGIALAAFAAAVIYDRRTIWFEAPSHRALTAYIAAGLALTTAFEWHALATGRWAYSSLMPVLPGIRIGLLPLLQWIALPPFVLFLTRRHYAGSPR